MNLTDEDIDLIVASISELARAIADDATADPNESWIGEQHYAEQRVKEKLKQHFQQL